MDHYIDIQIKPDAEMRENVLLNKVYTKFHKALFFLKSTDIGISFPRYKVLLGNIVRIHGTESRLLELQNTNWLGGLSGYCKMAKIQAIPNDVSYRTISRKQANMTMAKLRRLLKRGSISVQEAKKYKAKMHTQSLDNPFFELNSTSNGNTHRRYIEFGEFQNFPAMGKFDFFGLSKQATVPWF